MLRQAHEPVSPPCFGPLKRQFCAMQHLRIKQFYGASENAVTTQIWIAVSVCVVISSIKKRLQVERSPYGLLHVLSLMRFEKTTLQEALRGANAPKKSHPPPAN